MLTDPEIRLTPDLHAFYKTTADRAVLAVPLETRGAVIGVRELLGGEGYTVVDAPDGPSGLALCETEPVDVVLSDVSMPGMSGWEVAEACHARFPDLPVGLITGWGGHLDPAQLARHGVRFVVAKPFQAAEVLHRVGDALAASDRT